MDTEKQAQILSILKRMFKMYGRTDFDAFDQMVYLHALAPYPFEAIQDGMLEAMSAEKFLPKPATIIENIIKKHPELDPKRKVDAMADKAMSEIRRFVKTVDSGADYVFEDYRLCLAIKHQYGSLASVGASREDDQLMINKLMYSYRDVCKSFLSHKIDEDHQLLGIYGGRDPRIVYFGNFEVCDLIAHRLYSSTARFPMKRLLPVQRPLLESKPMPIEQQQAMLQRVIEELKSMTKPNYE